jgi:hypothetical protein
MTYVEGGPPETEADWRRVADTQTFTVEVLEELGLPREISVAPGTECYRLCKFADKWRQGSG